MRCSLPTPDALRLSRQSLAAIRCFCSVATEPAAVQTQEQLIPTMYMLPVQLGHERRDVGRQLLAGQLGDGGEAEGGATGRVERRRMVRQVHKLRTEFDFDLIS